MKTRSAVEYYGGKLRIAEVLGISNAAVYQWREVVPYHSATLLAEKSQGRLPLEPDDYGSGGRIQATAG